MANPNANEPAHTLSCMDSWARAQGLATYSEMKDALRELLDMWHGGHLQVRQEALGAWHAAVQTGEDAIAKGTHGVGVSPHQTFRTPHVDDSES